MSFGTPRFASTTSCASCGCAETSCEACAVQGGCCDPGSCCCTDAHRSWRLGRLKAGVNVEYIGTAWMGVEVAGSVIAGILAGSLALLAFGGDSIIELISGIAVLRLLRGSVAGGVSEGESERTERITSLLLFALIPVIGVGSAYSYFAGIRAEGSQLGIAVSLGALILMPYLWNQKRTIGKETKTLALTFDAAESVTCVFMAVALLGSLLAEYFLGLWWADYAATAVILGFVAKEAVDSWRETNDQTANGTPTPRRGAALLLRHHRVLGGAGTPTGNQWAERSHNSIREREGSARMQELEHLNPRGTPGFLQFLEASHGLGRAHTRAGGGDRLEPRRKQVDGVNQAGNPEDLMHSRRIYHKSKEPCTVNALEPKIGFIRRHFGENYRNSCVQGR